MYEETYAVFVRIARRAVLAGASALLILSGAAHAEFGAPATVAEHVSEDLTLSVDTDGKGTLAWRRPIDGTIWLASRGGDGLIGVGGSYASGHSPAVASAGDLTLAYVDASGGLHADTFPVDPNAENSTATLDNSIDGVTPIAAAAPGGLAIVVWRKSDVVWYSVRNGVDASWSTPVDVSGAGTATSFDVAMGADGSATIVFVRDSVLYGATRSGQGAFGSPQVIAASGGGLNAPNSPDVAVSTTGVTQVVWAQTGGTNDVVRRSERLAGAAVAYASPTTLNTGVSNGYAPKVALDDAGHWTIVWRQGGADPANDRIYVQWHDDLELTTATPISDALGTTMLSPTVDVNGDGAAVVAWGRNGHVESTTRADAFATTAFDAAEVVSVQDTVGQPVAGIDAAGESTLAWYDATGVRSSTTLVPASVVQFTSNGFSVTEGTVGTINLERTNATGAGSVTVRLKNGASDITFADKVVTFAAGETQKSVQVVPINDTVDEPTEVAQFELVDLVQLELGTRAVTSLLIEDNDEPAPAPPATPTPPVSIIGTAQDPFANLFGYTNLTQVREVPASPTIGLDVRPGEGSTPPGVIGEAASTAPKFTYAAEGKYRFATITDVQSKLRSLYYDASTGAGYSIDVAGEPVGIQAMDLSLAKRAKAGYIIKQSDAGPKHTTPSDRLRVTLQYYEPELNCGDRHKLVDAAISAERAAAQKLSPGGWRYEDAVRYILTTNKGWNWAVCDFDVVRMDVAGIPFERVAGEKVVKIGGVYKLQLKVEVPTKSVPHKPKACPIATLNSMIDKPWDESAPGKRDGAEELYMKFRTESDRGVYDCRFDVQFERSKHVSVRTAVQVSHRKGDPVATILVWEPYTTDLVTTVRFQPSTKLRTSTRNLPPMLKDGKLSAGTSATFAVAVSQLGVAVAPDGSQSRLLGGAQVDVWFDPNGIVKDAVLLTQAKTNVEGHVREGETNPITVKLPGPGNLRINATWWGVGANGTAKVLTGWHSFGIANRAWACYPSTVPNRAYSKQGSSLTAAYSIHEACPTKKSGSATKSTARGARHDACMKAGGNLLTCFVAGIQDLVAPAPGSSKPAPELAKVAPAFTCKGGEVARLPREPVTGASSAMVIGADGSRQGSSDRVINIPPTCVLTAVQLDAPGINSTSSGVISTGGGNVISTGGGNVISTGGGNVISTGGGNVISTGGGNVISTGGGNVISTGGGNLIGQAGGNVISTGGGN